MSFSVQKQKFGVKNLKLLHQVAISQGLEAELLEGNSDQALRVRLPTTRGRRVWGVIRGGWLSYDSDYTVEPQVVNRLLGEYAQRVFTSVFATRGHQVTKLGSLDKRLVLEVTV